MSVVIALKHNDKIYLAADSLITSATDNSETKILQIDVNTASGYTVKNTKVSIGCVGKIKLRNFLMNYSYGDKLDSWDSWGMAVLFRLKNRIKSCGVKFNCNDYCSRFSYLSNLG